MSFKKVLSLRNVEPSRFKIKKIIFKNIPTPTTSLTFNPFSIGETVEIGKEKTTWPPIFSAQCRAKGARNSVKLKANSDKSLLTWIPTEYKEHICIFCCCWETSKFHQIENMYILCSHEEDIQTLNLHNYVKQNKRR